MSFSVKSKKSHSSVKGDVFRNSGKHHMDLVNQGLQPELIYDGEKWVYKNVLQPVENNSMLLINETCSSFLREYSTSE